MSDPVYQGNAPGYFLCDRDPTASEEKVSEIPFPSDWIVGWQNTVSGDFFRCLDLTEDALVWQRTVAGDVNKPRAYSAVSSPDFEDPRTPSATRDTFVSAIVSLSSTLITAAEVNAQIDSDSGYVTIATARLSGLVATAQHTLSFVVPANSTYQFTESGTAEIISILEMIS